MNVGGYPLEEENGTLGVGISKKMWREWDERLTGKAAGLIGQLHQRCPFIMDFSPYLFPDF
jgi:hypothetical protein